MFQKETAESKNILTKLGTKRPIDPLDIIANKITSQQQKTCINFGYKKHSDHRKDVKSLEQEIIEQNEHMASPFYNKEHLMTRKEFYRQ